MTTRMIKSKKLRSETLKVITVIDWLRHHIHTLGLMQQKALNFHAPKHSQAGRQWEAERLPRGWELRPKGWTPWATRRLYHTTVEATPSVASGIHNRYMIQLNWSLFSSMKSMAHRWIIFLDLFVQLQFLLEPLPVTPPSTYSPAGECSMTSKAPWCDMWWTERLKAEAVGGSPLGE